MLHVGNRIKKIMNAKGITNIDIAVLLDMHENSVYKMLKKSNQDTNVLQKIADYLEIPVTTFLIEEEEGSFVKATPKKVEKSPKLEVQNSFTEIIEVMRNSLLSQIEELKRDKVFLQEMLAK
jgi:transcriptional regulator with XRE-family HTH domain